MRLHHVAFISALICAGFAWGAPMAWDRHAALVVATLALLVLGLALATGSVVMDFLRPGRVERRRSQRDLDRAFRAGQSDGRAMGPSESTLRRWRSEGFGVPGVRR